MTTHELHAAARAAFPAAGAVSVSHTVTDKSNVTQWTVAVYRYPISENMDNNSFIAYGYGFTAEEALAMARKDAERRERG